MRPARRSLLLVLAAVLAAGPALASDKDDGSKPRRRKPPPAAARPVEAVNLRPTAGLAPPPVIALPPPLQSGSALVPGGLAAGGLASAGLRSGLPAFGDAGAQCRTGCAQSRLTCAAQEDVSSQCVPSWAMCVAACSR